jgi:hypothetical protein
MSSPRSSISPVCRSARGPTRPRSRSASATAYAGIDPRDYSRTAVRSADPLGAGAFRTPPPVHPHCSGASAIAAATPAACSTSNHAPGPPVRHAPKPFPTTPREPLDRPFHMRITAWTRSSGGVSDRDYRAADMGHPRVAATPAVSFRRHRVAVSAARAFVFKGWRAGAVDRRRWDRLTG